MNNILKSVCEHFALGSMPFLQRTKTPFESDSFLKTWLLFQQHFSQGI